MALNFMSAVGAFFAANEWLVSARFSQLAGYDYEARLHNRKAASWAAVAAIMQGTAAAKPFVPLLQGLFASIGLG